MQCNFSQFRQKAALLVDYQDCAFPPELSQMGNTTIVCGRCDHIHVLTFPFLTPIVDAAVQTVT